MRRLLLSAFLLAAGIAPALAADPAPVKGDELPPAPQGTVEFSADPKTPNYDAIVTALKDNIKMAQDAGFAPIVKVANVDLNGDGETEIIARLEDGIPADKNHSVSYFCGSAGCDTYVYGVVRGNWQLLMNVASQSVVVPGTTTNGYKDLGLEVRAGGYAYWRFDGKNYIRADRT